MGYDELEEMKGKPLALWFEIYRFARRGRLMLRRQEPF